MRIVIRRGVLSVIGAPEFIESQLIGVGVGLGAGDASKSAWE
jgi:hypothetical protein